MFETHFYHKTTQNIIAAFGSIFNDINVVRQSSNGDILSTERVPLAFGPKKKWLARLDQQRDIEESKTGIKLPRLSFEITGMSYDPSGKISKYQKVVDQLNNQQRDWTYSFSPYMINVALIAYTKNHDDMLQIVEQILPKFQPDHTLSIKGLTDLPNHIDDIPIVLSGVSPSYEYEGEFQSREIINYTMDFEIKAKFYNRINKNGVITTSIVNLRDLDDEGILQTITEMA